jgi:hypothetical protein
MTKSRFQGRDKVRRKLRTLPDIVVQEVRSGLAIAAQDVVDMQKRLVAVDDGDLRDSIRWQYGNEARTKYSQCGRGVKDALSVRITAGNTKVRYAHLVEFGAAPHIAGGIFEGASHPGAAAQPFFYPAYRARKKAAVSRIKRSMRRGAKKAFEA